MGSRVPLLLGMGIVWMSFSCKHRLHENQSEPKVFNGLNASANQFPSVVKLTDGKNKTCAGTFIASDTLLTASHCLFNQAIRYNDKTPVHTYTFAVPEIFSQKKFDQLYLDLAVIQYEGVVAPGIANLALTPVPLGQAITFVGFGSTEMTSEKNVGTKRFGNNVVIQGAHEITDSGMFAFQAVQWNEIFSVKGEQSGGGHGDSGGPVFLRENAKSKNDSNRMGGVLSIILKSNRMSYAVDLHSAASQRLLGCVTAVNPNIKILGVSGESDAAHQCSDLMEGP